MISRTDPSTYINMNSAPNTGRATAIPAYVAQNYTSYIRTESEQDEHNPHEPRSLDEYFVPIVTLFERVKTVITAWAERCQQVSAAESIRFTQVKKEPFLERGILSAYRMTQEFLNLEQQPMRSSHAV